MPETISHLDMERRLSGGPQLKNAVFVLLGDRIYKREGNLWRLLDNKPLVIER